MTETVCKRIPMNREEWGSAVKKTDNEKENNDTACEKSNCKNKNATFHSNVFHKCNS